MPKIKYAATIPDNNNFTNFYNAEDYVVVSSTSKKVVIVGDDEDGSLITFTGSGLGIGRAAKDIVTGIKFESAAGDDFVSIKHGNYDFTDLYDKLETDGFDDFLASILKGRDKLTGSNAGESMQSGAGRDVIIARGGDDFIDGGLGKNILVGGSGADKFVFTGHNVIKDFDADNSSQDHDLLFVEYVPEYEVHKVKGGVVVDFDEGHTSVKLLGVNKADFDDGDFFQYGVPDS